jgi:hypothetical protein
MPGKVPQASGEVLYSFVMPFLGLGASRAVTRPRIFRGAESVQQVVRNVLSEIDLTLAPAGHASSRTLGRGALGRPR